MKKLGMIIGAACALLGACGGDLENGSQIAKLRLLALRADQPFARPGERVELQLLAADAEARPLELALATCRNPRSSTVQGCLDALDGPFEPLVLEDDRFSLDVPHDMLDTLSAHARPSALFGALLAACPGTLETGRTADVPIACRGDDGARLPIERFEIGYKRIFIRSEDRNQNPEILALRWDGEPWPEDRVPEVQACDNATTRDIEDCPEALRHAIGVQSSTPERGVDENGTRFVEQQVVQFYASAGVFERAARVSDESENHWALQPLAAGDIANLWVVVRDDRGGVSWVSRQVRLLP